jgi:hypothetical protein
MTPYSIICPNHHHQDLFVADTTEMDVLLLVRAPNSTLWLLGTHYNCGLFRRSGLALRLLSLETPKPQHIQERIQQGNST